MSKTLSPGALKRLPDGEPGDRQNFIRWQLERLVNEKGLADIIMPYIHPVLKLSREDWTPAEIEAALEMRPTTIETGYDTAAIASYRTFRKLKDEGRIAEQVRFQVGIPTPTNVVPRVIQPAFQTSIEPHYKRGLQAAIERIQQDIPNQELAFQMDLAAEFSVLHGGAWWVDGPV